MLGLSEMLPLNELKLMQGTANLTLINSSQKGTAWKDQDNGAFRAAWLEAQRITP